MVFSRACFPRLERTENVFDPSRNDGDALLEHAVAGLQATMAESMAIFARNINVYRRFKHAEFEAFMTETFSREFDWHL